MHMRQSDFITPAPTAPSHPTLPNTIINYIPGRTRSMKGGWEKKIFKIKVKPLTVHLNPGTHLVENRKRFYLLKKESRKHGKGLEHSMQAVDNSLQKS